MIIFTNKAKEFLTAAAAGKTRITFTDLKTSDKTDLTDGANVDFKSIKQEIDPSSVSIDDMTNTAVVGGLFSNKDLGSAYTIKAVGLYAMCAGDYSHLSPVLFAYETYDPGLYMPLLKDGANSYSFSFNTTISSSEAVNISIEPGAYASASDVQSLSDTVAQTAIGAVTHTKSGTVHTLTTANSAAENIKFAATADFNAGDTFKFNGTTVEAYSWDGLPLQQGYFTKNALVFCFYSSVSKRLYFPPVRYMERKNVRCNATASVATPFRGFRYRQEVTWDSMTANDYIDVVVSAGSHTGPLGVESAEGKAVLWFTVQPATSVYVNIYREVTTNV